MSSLVGRPIGGSIINKSSFIVIGLVVCTNLKCIYDTNCSHRQMIFIYIGNSMVRSRPELAHLLTLQDTTLALQSIHACGTNMSTRSGLPTCMHGDFSKDGL